jgi:hypothetical protein
MIATMALVVPSAMVMSVSGVKQQFGHALDSTSILIDTDAVFRVVCGD